MLLALPIRSGLWLFLMPLVVGFVVGVFMYRLVALPEQQHFSCVVPPLHYGAPL